MGVTAEEWAALKAKERDGVLRATVEIADKWAVQGIFDVRDIPDEEDKARLRALARYAGFKPKY